MTDVDPILAVIEQFRIARANLDAQCSALDELNTPWAVAELARLNDAIEQSEQALVVTVPTTLAGLRDLMRCLADHLAHGWENCSYYYDADDPVLNQPDCEEERALTYFIHRNAARFLDGVVGGAVQS